MKPMSVSEVLSRANASLVDADRDVTGALAALLGGATGALPADAAGVLVQLEGVLELLAATSHRVADLEAYQAQVDEGPCLDAIRSGESVGMAGDEAIVERWPVAGPFIVRSGYSAVEAVPLTWQGLTVGGLNLFRADATSFRDQRAECRALADAATLVILSAQFSTLDATDSMRAALADRAVVEHAKGALAHVRSLEMSAAYDELVGLADTEGLSLGVAAREVMRQARSGNLGRPQPL